MSPAAAALPDIAEDAEPEPAQADGMAQTRADGGGTEVLHGTVAETSFGGEQQPRKTVFSDKQVDAGKKLIQVRHRAWDICVLACACVCVPLPSN